MLAATLFAHGSAAFCEDGSASFAEDGGVRGAWRPVSGGARQIRVLAGVSRVLAMAGPFGRAQARGRVSQGGSGKDPIAVHDELTRSRIQLPPLMMFKIRHGGGTRSERRRMAAHTARRSESTCSSPSSPRNATTAAAHPEVKIPRLRLKRACQPRLVEAGTSTVTLGSSEAKIRSRLSRWWGTTKSGNSAWEASQGPQ